MKIVEKNNKLDINDGAFQLYSDIFGDHIKVGNRTYGDFPKVTKNADYFYSMEVNTLDEKYAYEALALSEVGGCSSARSGNFIVRSYDWYYNNSTTFFVHVTKSAAKHESWGIAQCSITQNEMSAESYSEQLKLLPFQTLDGLNDAGVYCSTNVVPTGDKGITTGTNPGKKDLCQIFIPRFVLDNSNSARHAVDLLMDRNIFAPNIRGKVQELHAKICDSTSTYIVECVNNKLSILSDQDDEFENIPNSKLVMTNAYLSGWNGEIKTVYRGNTAEEFLATGMSLHGTGLERYEILANGISTEITSVESAIDLIKKVRYTKAYDASVSPYWYSELAEYFVQTGLLTSLADYDIVKEKMIALFPTRSRDVRNTWQSVHQSVYDLQNKKLYVMVQENDEIFTFDLAPQQ